METSSERESNLADEIIESQKTRSDLLKWKFVICAVLGGIGFGFANNSGVMSIPLLALIPLACLYVDLLCTNLNIRIINIGNYFSEIRNDPYERFIGKRRVSFSLEDWALYGATYIISALLVLTGIYISLIRICFFLYDHKPLPDQIPKYKFVCDIAECVPVIVVASLSIWLTRKTIIAYKLALSDKKFEDEQNIEKAFVMGLTGSECLQQIINYLLVHKKKKKDDLIANYLMERYERNDAVRLYNFLHYHGTFEFRQLDNGLFPAISATDKDDTGYQHAWVRDNVHIAYAHYQWGDKEAASRTAGALMTFFQSQRQRMREIIKYPSLASDPMNRPHIRFDGQQIKELKQKWNHAQNDALGYFLWFYCKLARDKDVTLTKEEQTCLMDLVSYLEAIHYWKDKDSGHWEEVQKVSASSIGAVIAGLQEFKKLAGSDGVDLADQLTKGKSALDEILPYESKPLRRYDASLLFLIYPLNVVSRDQARLILQDVEDRLEGNIGIRRYPNDSYWHPDYRKCHLTTERTKDFSDGLAERDAFIKPGKEAQWCIFDPILACIYADQPDLSPEAASRQIHYLNRSLRQLAEYQDGSLLCPEAYFLEKGRYTPNDHVPLQWAQANLKLAIHLLMKTRDNPVDGSEDR